MDVAPPSQAELVKLLSKTDIYNIPVDGFVHSGNSPLHDAVLSGDADACRTEIIRCPINEQNLRGDSPLHLAVRWINENGVNLINILLQAGASVNVKNKWEQTPLHYAVSVNSLANVRRLLQEPNVDLDAQDVNGFTPLHCSISFDPLIVDRRVDPNYDLDFDADFLKIMDALVSAGASLNVTTNFGFGLLHLAAARDDNTPLLKHLVEKFQDLELNCRTNLGENFLHIYFVSEVVENLTDIFHVIISNFSKSTLSGLLSTEDTFGKAPWANLIATANVNEETIQSIIDLGVCVNNPDNLGNTALHRLTCVSDACVLTEILDMLVRNGSNIQTENVFQETPPFLLFLDSVFEVFKNYSPNFNAHDRWGRTPLMSLIKHRPIPELLYRIVREGRADVNATDKNGTTPLHLAAYHNFPEQVKNLLELGAQRNATDKLNDTPLDTVKRHCSFQCYSALKESVSQEQIYTRSKSFDEILLDLPKIIKASDVVISGDIQSRMGLPDDRKSMWNFLLSTYYERSEENAQEVDTVVLEVKQLVVEICNAVESYDKRFKMTIFPTGSTVEGTKVGRPDEFDFVLCIDSLGKMTSPVLRKKCLETGFACLKFNENPPVKEVLPFCDSEGYFLALPFLQLFNKYLKRALYENRLWTRGNLYYNYEDKMAVISGKPVFNFSVYWIGSVYKQLKISIDLVPAVYQKGWWPANINVGEIPMMTAQIKQAGCFLIMQAKTNEFDTKANQIDNNINFTCNNDHGVEQRRMLRVSAAPAEITLMKSLPANFRRAYALGKIVKGKEVCPKIILDSIDHFSHLCMHMTKFSEKSRNLEIKPSHIIKSYMLKNCVFYAFLGMKNRDNVERIPPSVITTKMFSSLLHFANERYLNPYFLPYSDVFEFEKDIARSTYDEFIHKLKRELCIKLVLGILGDPLPSVSRI